MSNYKVLIINYVSHKVIRSVVVRAIDEQAAISGVAGLNRWESVMGAVELPRQLPTLSAAQSFGGGW